MIYLRFIGIWKQISLAAETFSERVFFWLTHWTYLIYGNNRQNEKWVLVISIFAQTVPAMGFGTGFDSLCTI